MVLFSVDREGIFFSEGSGLKLLGLRSGEHVGTSIFSVYADYETVLQHLERAREGESGTFLQTMADRLLEIRSLDSSITAGRVSHPRLTRRGRISPTSRGHLRIDWS